jgi:hypothetical protein
MNAAEGGGMGHTTDQDPDICEDNSSFQHYQFPDSPSMGISGFGPYLYDYTLATYFSPRRDYRRSLRLTRLGEDRT